MKKNWLLFVLLAFFSLTVAPACGRKSGCPAQESLKPKTNKKGEIIGKKRGKSDLFPKNMRKRMK